jgi:hypothetical protein
MKYKVHKPARPDDQSAPGSGGTGSEAAESAAGDVALFTFTSEAFEPAAPSEARSDAPKPDILPATFGAEERPQPFANARRHPFQEARERALASEALQPTAAPDTGEPQFSSELLDQALASDADADALDWPTHSEPLAGPEAGRRRKITFEVLIAVAVLLLGAWATVFYFRSPGAPAPAAAAGTVPESTTSISSQPEGADIVIDGVAHGKTPAKLPIAPGRHVLTVSYAGTARSIVLDVEPGTNLSQYIEFAAPAATALAGRLEVTSDPSGAQVNVDGEARGRTPLTLNSVSPGEHTVTISNGSSTVTRRVTVTASQAASIFASVGTSGTAAGWLSVQTPIQLEIYEDGRLLGTTAAERLMLPAGRHQLDLVSSALDFRERVAIQITPGGTTTTAVATPNGTLSVNALPWADVWIDGKPFGATPLGNISLPIGSHEVVWRHPQFGERRRTVSVGASTPVRVGVDFGQ